MTENEKGQLVLAANLSKHDRNVSRIFTEDGKRYLEAFDHLFIWDTDAEVYRFER